MAQTKNKTPKARPTTKRRKPTALPKLQPTDIYIAAPDTFDPQAARRALVIVCDDDVLREQIKREMRVMPLRSEDDAKAEARLKRARMNGRIAAVVPNYNYGRFITDALESLVTQTRPPDEIIVVDDASTDDSVDIVEKWMMDDAQTERIHTFIHLIRHDRNTGNVGGPRNTGIAATDAEFIICLDSDDMLEPEYIETLLPAIQDRHEVGVVYSGVQTQEDSTTGERRLWPGWPRLFDWQWTTTLLPDRANTCIPTASLFRREMWERCGGYDAGRRAAEDADFWPRGLSVGFEAVKATEEPLFVYRRHGDSMSARKILRMDTWNIAYRGHLPLAAPTGKPPVMRDYTHPSISVIIPVGPGHGDKLPTAIHSVVSQTFTNWEIVIVDDTGGESLAIAAYPFARLIGTRGKEGAGAARNAGLRAAKGSAAFFLDADDFLMPRALELMARRYAAGDAGYVYSGWWKIYDDGKPGEVIPDTYQPMIYNHPVSVLIAVEDALKIGGFDESMEAFEDWEFFVRCGIAGLCGARVPDALLGYRMATGERRTKGLAMQSQIADYIKREHGDYIEGRKQIMACCGGNAIAVEQAGQDVNRRTLPTYEGDGTVLMRYVGNYAAAVGYNGNAGRSYSGCKDCAPVNVHPDDIQRLQDTGVWALVKDDMPSIPQPAMIYTDGDANA